MTNDEALKSPERQTSRNGYRERRFGTRVGSSQRKVVKRGLRGVEHAQQAGGRSRPS